MKARVQRGPFATGDQVQLTDPKGRMHQIILTDGGTFHTHRGALSHDDLIGQPEGSVVTATSGTAYVALRPLLADFTLAMKRGATIVYPKDAAQILAYADVFPGARVLEAGAGSGALSCWLLRAIGPDGELVSFEARQDFAEIARENVRKYFGEVPAWWRLIPGELSARVALDPSLRTSSAYSLRRATASDARPAATGPRSPAPIADAAATGAAATAATGAAEGIADAEDAATIAAIADAAAIADTPTIADAAAIADTPTIADAEDAVAMADGADPEDPAAIADGTASTASTDGTASTASTAITDGTASTAITDGTASAASADRTSDADLPDAGTFDRVILDMLAPWENVAGAARALIPGGLICCYVATTTQLSRVVEELRAHGGFFEPAAWETLNRGWHVDGLAVRPDHRMIAHTGFLVTARRLADGVTAPTRRRRPAKGAHPEAGATRPQAPLTDAPVPPPADS